MASIGMLLASDSQVDGIWYKFEYNSSDGSHTAKVIYRGNSYSAYSNEYADSVIIPETVYYNRNTYKVIEIWSDAFRGCSNLKYVSIPSSVTRIGSDAFRDCINLSTVEMADGVSQITSRAFYNCVNLISITLPNSLTSMQSEVFYNCRSLTSIVIPDSVSIIFSRTFKGCSSLNSVSIGNSVTSIDAAAFEECNSLPSIIIPENVTSIGDRAFANCTTLTFFDTGNGVEQIGNSVLDGCTNLSTVIVGENVNSFAIPSDGESVFKGCTSLTSVVWNAINCSRYIINDSDNPNHPLKAVCSQITSFIFGDKVEYIPSYLCRGMSNLSSISLPESVIDMGHNVFQYCTGLTSPLFNSHVFAYMPNSYSGAYIIPDGIEVIAGFSFGDQYDLTAITIPNTMKKIGEGAFSNCSSLTSVTIPDNVISIGNKAFYRCNNLVSVSIGNSVANIGYEAFYGCSSLTSVHISDLAAWCKIEFGDDSANPLSNAHNLYLNGELITNLVIPDDITDIAKYAFFTCTCLSTIISKSVVPPTIYSTTFYGINNDVPLYVPGVPVYQNAPYWKDMNLQAICSADKSEKATSVAIIFSHNVWTLDNSYIASIGIEGGDQQAGNVLEYIGLEPNSEYKDIPVVLTSNTGETETVNVSFTTTALELSTQASKPVSSNTAILLAQTNMADSETSCGFEWKRTTAPDEMAGTKVYCPVANGQMAGRLKNLKDDVYYKYRAFYQSAAGNMYYGDWQYIFTGDASVEFDPILYTYAPVVVREHEATISGYALAGSEDFTEQGFEYWAERRAEQEANASHRMPASIGEHHFVQATGIRMTANLTDLDEGTVYKYRAYGKVGEQYYYGAEQTFTTLGEWQKPTAIETIQDNDTVSSKATKLLRNGQIFILRGDKVYTVTGQEVR